MFWRCRTKRCETNEDCGSQRTCRRKCCIPSQPINNQPSFQPTAESPVCTSNSTSAHLAFAEEKDLIYGSYLNGPFKGQQASFAWPQSSSPCTYPGESIDPYKPCAVDHGFLNRVMTFFSYYQEFRLDLDDGMLGSIKLGTNAYSCVNESLSFFPAGASGAPCVAPPDMESITNGGYGVRLVRSGRYLHHWYFQSLTCDSSMVRMELKVTPDCIEVYLVTDDGSPVQWIVNGIPKASNFSMAGYSALSYCVRCHEGKSWDDNFSDCRIIETPVEHGCCMLGLNMCGVAGPIEECRAPIVTTDSSDVVFTMDESDGPSWIEGEILLPIRRFHHFAWNGLASYLCVGNATHSGEDAVGVWPPAKTKLTSSCLTKVGIPELVATRPFLRSRQHDKFCTDGSVGVQLAIEYVNRSFENVQDTGTSYGIDGECLLTAYYGDVLYTPTRKPYRGDGHTILVKVPNYQKDVLINDHVTVRATNNAIASATDSGWRKLKLAFHIDKPVGITGIGAFLQDPDTLLPLGVHIQLSKDWHLKSDDPQLYDGYWWTGVTNVRVPPSSTTSFQLVIVFQFFGPLHGVSHSQLSLVGWGTNGLWEQVGLGSNGESMTYEPDPHHRRSTILDTRPFLTCRAELSGPCGGNPNSTGWTDNHGGSDWFSAITSDGFYQYLVNNTALHQMNGPRLTNVTYVGKTVDGNWNIQRTASTWSTDATVKHLHSFEYKVQKDISGNPYGRFSIFVLGRDDYNYIEVPHFVYGTGSVLLDNKTHTELDPTGTLQNFQYAPNYHNVPPGCSSSESCWFGMLTPEGSQLDHEAHRGIIIRQFHARLNGTETSDFTFSVMRNGNRTVPRLILEIGLPLWFLESLQAGTAQFRQGDFIRGDIEQLLPPRESAVYYGDSQRLRQWYADANVLSEYSNAWKILSLEAQRGDAFQVNILQGSLERKYPPRIHVSEANEAQFTLEMLADDWPGVLPISIAGVQQNTFALGGKAVATTYRLYRWSNIASAWQVFGVGVDGSSDFQLDREISDGTFTFTYSLRLEFDAVQSCEHFVFGSILPDSSNSSCSIFL